MAPRSAGYKAKGITAKPKHSSMADGGSTTTTVDNPYLSLTVTSEPGPDVPEWVRNLHRTHRERYEVEKSPIEGEYEYKWVDLAKREGNVIFGRNPPTNESEEIVDIANARASVEREFHMQKAILEDLTNGKLQEDIIREIRTHALRAQLADHPDPEAQAEQLPVREIATEGIHRSQSTGDDCGPGASQAHVSKNIGLSTNSKSGQATSGEAVVEAMEEESNGIDEDEDSNGTDKEESSSTHEESNGKDGQDNGDTITDDVAFMLDRRPSRPYSMVYKAGEHSESVPQLRKSDAQMPAATTERPETAHSKPASSRYQTVPPSSFGGGKTRLSDSMDTTEFSRAAARREAEEKRKQQVDASSGAQQQPGTEDRARREADERQENERQQRDKQERAERARHEEQKREAELRARRNREAAERERERLKREAEQQQREQEFARREGEARQRYQERKRQQQEENDRRRASSFNTSSLPGAPPPFSGPSAASSIPGVQPSFPPANANAGEIERAWAAYEQAWAELPNKVELEQVMLRWQDIPWPMIQPPQSSEGLVNGGISNFILSPTHSQGKSHRERLREALLRWHPDHFWSRWLPKCAESEREEIKKGVELVVRCLNELVSVQSTLSSSS